jgi:hypothetical protein
VLRFNLKIKASAFSASFLAKQRLDATVAIACELDFPKFQKKNSLWG